MFGYGAVRGGALTPQASFSPRLLASGAGTVVVLERIAVVHCGSAYGRELVEVPEQDHVKVCERRAHLRVRQVERGVAAQ
eukprot:6958374-Pyramimonas_sp.AAC.1